MVNEERLAAIVVNEVKLHVDRLVEKRAADIEAQMVNQILILSQRIAELERTLADLALKGRAGAT